MSETPSTNYSAIQPHTSGSEQSLSMRPFNVTEPTVAKRVCFYKSGDPQFNGVKMVVNNRSFKSFDALLDNLSTKVPLPFGVRNITTPRGMHSISHLEDLEDGKSYICSQQRKVKPINLEMAKRKPLPWQNSRPISARRKAVQLSREGESSVLQKRSAIRLSSPKRLLVFKNGNVRIRRTVALGKKSTESFEAFLDHISELMHYPVVKLYTTDGRKVPNLQALVLCSGAVVAAGREPFRAGNYDPHRYSLPGKLPGVSNRVHPRTEDKSEGRKMSTQIDSSSRSQMFSASSYKGYSNDNNSESSYVPDNDMGLGENNSQTGEDFSLVPAVDDIEKHVHLNQDGSMTVEMRVRFNIKEDETIKWTTRVSRAGTSMIVTDPSSELNILASKNPIEDFISTEDDISLKQITTEETNQDSEYRMESNNYDIWQNPSLNIEENQTNNDPANTPFYRPPTPGPRRIQQKKAMVEHVTVVSDKAVQKKLVGQFSYSEEMDNGETTSKYCVVTHTSSKTTDVSNTELSEVCSSHGLKQLQDNHTEEKTLTIDTMRSDELTNEDTSLQNVSEKAVVQEGLSNSITPGCDSSIRYACSLEKYNAAGQPLLNQSDEAGRETNSFNNCFELSLLKSEKMLCSQCREQYSSQVSVYPLSLESNKMVHKCTQINSSIKESSITAENDSVETMTTTQLSDESQAASSSSKKKKKKKKKKKIKPSTDAMGQDINLKQNLNGVLAEGINENEVQTSEMHIRRGYAQHSSGQTTVQKRESAFPVNNSEDTNKNLIVEGELYSQVSVKSQQNKSASNLKKNIRQLPKLKAKSDKKQNLSPSTKAEDGLLLIKNEMEPIKGDPHETPSVMEQIPTHLISLNPLVETKCGETENGKIPSQKLQIKHRKAKKDQKNESDLGSKVNVPDESIISGALRHTNLSDEITEQSIENYVQSWLQNIFPDVVWPQQHLAPIISNDKKSHQLSFKSLSEKDIRLAGKNVCLTEKNNIISEGKQSNSTLNKLSEIKAVEASVKKLQDRHIGYLTDADASLIEEVKHLLQSDIHNKKQHSLRNIMQEAPLEGAGQKHISEIAAQIHSKAITNIQGPDIQRECVSSLLLRELKSAVLAAEKNSIGGITKPSCPADSSSPSLLCSSSNLLLAWLLLLNLQENLSMINKDDIVQTTYRCSEIFILLQCLKHVATKEDAEDLKTAVSNMEDCTANCLIRSAVQSEIQEPLCCEENIPLAEIKNISDDEEQVTLSQMLILSNTIDSEEVKDAKELSEESKKSTEEQKNSCMSAENEILNDLDDHNPMRNLDCSPARSHDFGLTSNKDLLKENEDSSLLESQEKHTDTSLNNEESEISEEPNSTSHSMASQDRDHIFDLETSELDEKELKSTEEKECTESSWKKENSSGYPTSVTENGTSDRSDDSVQEALEKNVTCEETSEQISTPSPLSFCYESKQIPVDTNEEVPISRVKCIVKELECGSHTNSSLEFKKCLKSPVTSDLSDYRSETDESFNNCRPSSDLTNESADEAVYEKDYNKGYVKRTIERLYGKTEASSKSGPLYLARTLQKDTAESLHTVMEATPSFSHVCNAWADGKMPASQGSHESLEDLNKANNMWEKENATLPAPQFSLNGAEAYCDDNCSVQYMNQHNQSQAHTAEDGGILIDKGKWLLKENHLIRRSPPENTGIYGNVDTTSTETILDNHSDDIPYSHFGNMDQRPPLKEISSSELEDMAKPCDNGCSYFNMPHNSDSELFADPLSIKSKNSQNGSTLPWGATNKICTTSTQVCAEENAQTFTSVEFRLPDNKVHPLQQPSNDNPIQTQPNSNPSSNRNTHEDQDSLDKLHAICGQHCPILTAIIKPTNEEIRGCAYRKASDVENQMGLHLLMGTPPFMWQSKNLIGHDNNYPQLKNSSINKITNTLFDRFYADNTLDFMNDNNFRLLLSLKENQGLKKLFVAENTNTNPQEINNHGHNATNEASGEVAMGQNNSLSTFQKPTGNSNQTLRENPSPSSSDVTEAYKSETLYHQAMFPNNTDWKRAANLEGENALNSKEETLPCVKDQDNSNEHSES